MTWPFVGVPMCSLPRVSEQSHATPFTGAYRPDSVEIETSRPSFAKPVGVPSGNLNLLSRSCRPAKFLRIEDAEGLPVLFDNALRIAFCNDRSELKPHSFKLGAL